MIYKRINEKYKDILSHDLKERNKVEKKKINEAEKAAADQYKSNKKAIEKILKELMSLLKKHEDDFKKDGETNWGMSGDMGRVKNSLLDILEYMKPMKQIPKDVEWIKNKGKDVFRKMGR